MKCTVRIIAFTGIFANFAILKFIIIFKNAKTTPGTHYYSTIRGLLTAEGDNVTGEVAEAYAGEGGIEKEENEGERRRRTSK